MIYAHSDISGNFDTTIDAINTIVIENRTFFFSFIEDIYNRVSGFSGKSILGTGEGKLLDFSKNAEIFTSFVPFEINKKSLLSKIISAIEKESVSAEHYEDTMKVLTGIERYLDGLNASFDCNLSYSKITPGALIKAAGIEIVDDYNSLAEKIIDYMELVREFDKDKLFFTVNLRSYIDDETMGNFMATIKAHDFHLIMIESQAHNMLSCESRHIIDEDLCEF